MFSGSQEESLNHHRTLFLSYLDTSNAAIKDLAERAEVLSIAGIKGGAKSIIPDIFQSMNHLTELLICDSNGIECLVDTCLIEVGTLFFSMLHWLRIDHMEHLRALYNGGMPLGGHFENLEDLCISHCPKLTCLFTLAVAQNLAKLEKLQLRYVFGQSTHKDGQNQNEVQIELSALEELTLVILPNINSICPEDCYLMWPSLLRFNLQNCGELCMVSINSCMALYNNPIISEASHPTVQNIKEVRVNNCELEGIFQLVGLPIDGEKDQLMSCLEMLYLENLPQLRLKCIFSSCMVGGLPQLKALKIEKCNQLDQIVEDIGTAIPFGT
ncbi:hypothetical protein TSUD_249450 [Trifolium subterraneum]|nr:hypothetical protein TSUD_249450 [Trifolium subterraneum]